MFVAGLVLALFGSHVLRLDDEDSDLDVMLLPASVVDYGITPDQTEVVAAAAAEVVIPTLPVAVLEHIAQRLHMGTNIFESVRCCCFFSF